MDEGPKAKHMRDGVGEVKLEDVGKLSNFQLKEMLKSCAWREVRASWEQEMSEKAKLKVLRMIVDKDCKGRSAQIESKEVRRMVTKLRGGTAQLHIETRRWKREGREEKKCKECSEQEVEDAKHFLLKCARWQDERKEQIERVRGTQRGGNLKQRMRMGSWHVHGKKSGDGDQKDVEEEICATVNNSL